MSILERFQLLLGSIKCCCRTPLYFVDKSESVFVSDFRLALVWSDSLNAPLLLKGIRCIPGVVLEFDFTCKKSHQCTWTLFSGANQSTEAGTSRIPFKA